MGRIPILLAAALLLSACVGTRPKDAAVCQPPAPDAVTEAASPAGGVPRDELDILVLSGGGPRGAFGAGFLNGWTARQTGIRRPEFDIVTGVSTGAIMAPFALLGPKWDGVLTRNYSGVAASDLFESRSIFRIFAWTSVKNPAPLVARLHAALDDQTLSALAEAARAHRMVWVGATNFDTGNFDRFNLTTIAGTQPPDQARARISERIVAASSIPVFLPPQFIDGCMYMDGGVRENLFLAQIGGSIREALRDVRAPKVEIFVIINGSVDTFPQSTNDTLVAIAARSFDLVTTQIQLASLRDAYDYAHDNHYGFHWTSADGLVSKGVEPGKCGPSPRSDEFNAAFTTCLFEAARRKAESDTDPWRTDRP